MTNPATSLQTDPAAVTFGARENWAVGIDCTNLLAGYPAATPTSPAVVFTNNVSGAVVTLADPPTVAGMVVSQRITAAEVARGQTYQLTVTVAPSTAPGDTLEAVLAVTVPGYS